MPIGELGILRDRDAAVVVVIPQGNINWGDLAQPSQEPEEIRQPFRDVQQVSCDKNPIWLKILDGEDHAVVTRLVPIDMKIAEMNRPAPGKMAADMRELCNLVVVEADFPIGKEAKKPVERLAQGMSDKGPDSIGPGGNSSDHFMTRS